MTILPIDPVANATPEALRAFLASCREAAQRDGHAKLVSISIAVDALDPLAVLESIFEPDEPHFYAERVSLDTAIAGAEAVVAMEAHGPERFGAVQRFIDETLAHTIAVGEVEAAFGGPHFFAAFAFEQELAPGEPFPAARVFVPRWQVARAGSGTTAVANLLVTPDAPLELLAEKVWRAHGKFRKFEYGRAEGSGTGVSPVAGQTPAHGRDARATTPESQAHGRDARATTPEPQAHGRDAPATSQPIITGGTPVPPLDARATLKVTDQGDYPAAVAQAIARIAAGEFTKIVLARTRTVEANAPLHPLEMLNQLRQRFPECYAFSIANGRGQSFIGATPERLARVSRGVLETEALAGSAPRGASATEDARLGAELLRSDKDRREQRLVLDSIQRRLTPLGFVLEFPAEPVLKKLANVQHLFTPVRAVLPPPVRLLDVLAQLHPTPAVGGSPRAAAMAGIRQLEGFSRGLYAGAIGWLNARGGGEFFVGLRSALVDGPTARLFAGAGIVAGSSPEKESAETELKFRAMQEALKL